VNRLGVGDFGRADQRRHVQVAQVGRRRADTDGLVGELHILGFLVGLGIDDDSFDAELAARALNPERDLAAIGNENFFKHSGFSTHQWAPPEAAASEDRSRAPVQQARGRQTQSVPR